MAVGSMVEYGDRPGGPAARPQTSDIVRSLERRLYAIRQEIAQERGRLAQGLAALEEEARRLSAARWQLAPPPAQLEQRNRPGVPRGSGPNLS